MDRWMERRTDTWKFTPVFHRTSALWDHCTKKKVKTPILRPYPPVHDCYCTNVVLVKYFLDSHNLESLTPKKGHGEDYSLVRNSPFSFTHLNLNAMQSGILDIVQYETHGQPLTPPTPPPPSYPIVDNLWAFFFN